MTTDMRWEDPPPSNKPSDSVDWDLIAASLRQAPGRWALVLPGAKYNTRANYIRTSRIAAFRPMGAFEATARTVRSDNGHVSYDIYARYVGDGSE